MQCKVLLYVYLLELVKHVSPTEVKVSPDTAALLPCITTLPPFGERREVDIALIDVSWTSNGSVLASTNRTEKQVKEGYSWDTSLFINGTFSLTVLKASLSHQGAYECRVTFNSTNLLSSEVTLSIKASPTISVPSQWVVLEVESEVKCRAEGFYPPPISFALTRDGEVVPQAQAAEGELKVTPEGYYLATSNLRLYPTKEDENVTFGCEVTHTDEKQVFEFKLNITYLPTVRLSAVPPASRNTPITLFCDVEGFYPEDVSVSWLQNNTVLPEPLPSMQSPDGTYTTRRYFTLSAEQRERAGEVQCVVHQPGVNHPEHHTAYLEELDPPEKEPKLTKSAKASVALMCISLVLVFLLCFGFSWRRRDEKQKYLNVSCIVLPPKVIVGKKGRVTLSIEGRRVDRVQTAWFLNDTPIYDTTVVQPLRASTVSTERGSLLPSKGDMGYYKLHTQPPLRSSNGSTQQLLSSLSFIPQISIHKGAVFKCQVSYIDKDKVVAERVSDKFTILAAPEVSEIQLAETVDDSGVIALTVQAAHFHPDIITFRWFCEGGELSPVSSQALSAPRPDSQGFFSATSQCRLPSSELETGGTRVWVSVHHIALKKPVTRETRGFIKRPTVSEVIPSSRSSLGQPLTLGCDITGFYPPDILVTWLRLRQGEEDDGEEEVIEGGEVWGPVQTDPTIYRATATLRKDTTKEKAGGVVCRVEHCSLELPILRRWRNVDIAAPSIPPSISACWSSEGVGVFSLLLKGGTPKAKVLWAAGGDSLLPLVSNETEDISDNGQKELKSVCALERPIYQQSQKAAHTDTQMNGHAFKTETKAAVTDPDTEGIKYIDEKEDDDNNNTEREEVTKTEVVDDSDGESDGNSGALQINRVSLGKGTRGDDRQKMRVCVEITHPALALPVHLTWTEINEEVSSL